MFIKNLFLFLKKNKLLGPPAPQPPSRFQQKKPNNPINIPAESPKKPNIFEELKPTKIDDPDPTPKPKPSPQNVLTSSDVQIKDLNDNNFFGNKKPGQGGANGINFMSSNIQSFNDIPTLNSKIVPFKRPKLPSINKFGGGPGGGITSKIFNPNVGFSTINLKLFSSFF